MNNQECKLRLQVINVNSNNPICYSFSVKASKCSGSCSNINDPYAKKCVRDVVKDLYVKVCNLMSRTNETRHMKLHETCKCECRLDAIVCNNNYIMIIFCFFSSTSTIYTFSNKKCTVTRYLYI